MQFFLRSLRGWIAKFSKPFSLLEYIVHVACKSLATFPVTPIQMYPKMAQECTTEVTSLLISKGYYQPR